MSNGKWLFLLLSAVVVFSINAQDGLFQDSIYQDTHHSEDLLVEEEYTMEPITEQILSGEEEPLNKEQSVVIDEPPISSEVAVEVPNLTSKKKWIAPQYRYLGNLMQGGIEARIYKQFTLGVFYGRYQGKVAGSEEVGLIPDLENYSLIGSFYLGKEKAAFSDGLMFRFGVHHNEQGENDLVARIESENVPVILPGESQTGTQIGVAYHWQWKFLFANVGIEYITLGPYKNFVPLALTGGFVF